MKLLNDMAVKTVTWVFQLAEQILILQLPALGKSRPENWSFPNTSALGNDCHHLSYRCTLNTNSNEAIITLRLRLL